MVIHTKEDWKLWIAERQRFTARESQGFIEDMKALKIHILKLQELAPKDKANWPVGNALAVIDSLQRDFDRYGRHLEQLR